MSRLLEGKRAIITGGTRGIGKAIAKRFLEEGASLALFGQSEANGEAAIKELSPFLGDSQTVKFYQVNVANHEEVESAMKTVLSDLERVDILVNNAGVTRDNLLMKLTEEHWDTVLETNLKSVFNTCKALSRPMMKARFGKVINVTSVVGLIGNPGQTNYAASKAGMIGFTKSLAKELGSRGVLVNCIAPGFIATEMTDVLSDTQKELLLKQIPMGRLGQPEEIANVALFLASPYSDYVTGQVITADGGMTM